MPEPGLTSAVPSTSARNGFCLLIPMFSNIVRHHTRLVNNTTLLFGCILFVTKIQLFRYQNRLSFVLRHYSSWCFCTRCTLLKRKSAAGFVFLPSQLCARECRAVGPPSEPVLGKAWAVAETFPIINRRTAGGKPAFT